MSSQLYRSFLRVLEKWPTDPSKSGRDLGEYIRIRLAAAYRSREPRDVNSCQEIQESLERIANNKYKETFYVSKISSATGLSQDECHQLMTNEFLKAVGEERGVKSFFSRIFKKEKSENVEK